MTPYNKETAFTLTQNMPSIQVQTDSGKIDFHYIISTPGLNDARSIDANLPTLLWFHSLGFPHVFHSQFSDPLLQKFNLVVFDLRSHGDTEGDDLPQRYGIEQAAEDVEAFMDALLLPPCHFVAMDYGSPIALQIAVSHPNRVRSLFNMSQICLEEPPDVREGHRQVYDSWCSSFPSGSDEIDHERIMEAAYGYAQFMFSNHTTDLAKAMVNMSIDPAKKHWGYSRLPNYRIATLEFLANRKAQPKEALSRLQCPVKLAYGTDDVAYPQTYTEIFLRDLEDAGVNASLFVVQGAPHFIAVDYSHHVNPILHDFILQNDDRNPPPVSTTILSPWHEALQLYGGNPGGSKYESDDDFVISYPSHEY